MGSSQKVLWSLQKTFNPEVYVSVVEGFVQKGSSYRRRCPGLPRSLGTIGLHGKTNTLRFPFSSASEDFIVAQAQKCL